MGNELFVVKKTSVETKSGSSSSDSGAMFNSRVVPDSIASVTLRIKELQAAASPDKQLLAQEYYKLSEVLNKAGRKRDSDEALASSIEMVEKSWRDFDSKSKSTAQVVTRAVIDPRLVNHVVNTGRGLSFKLRQI
ncbi:MAG: hypothetical protein IPL73_23580 [Candidatus Obscuribacter sp.]|nr:hypothetical protein [Candidatus Obscuribacter sp.]